MTDAGASRDDLASVRDRLLGRIAEACARAGRDPRDVRLVAVTKSVPVDRIRAAVDAGFTLLGENRVQEAAGKIPAVPAAAWHLIGALQSNKAARAVELFDTIETVDSLRLARRLAHLAAERGREVPVLLQVNVDEDPAKAGYRDADLERELPELLRLPSLRVEGLMTVGRVAASPDEARPTFRRLRELGERLRSGRPRLGRELSMGMSDDFEAAVEEGATVVRIGRAIFGERAVPGR